MNGIATPRRRPMTLSAVLCAAPWADAARWPANARPRPSRRNWQSERPPCRIGENDPLLPYLESAHGAVELDGLELDSAALRALRAAGVSLVVPLVSHGELVGTLNLGPRLSDQDYSADDRRLLESLAAQAAPALRVAQLVSEQEAEAVSESASSTSSRSRS